MALTDILQGSDACSAVLRGNGGTVLDSLGPYHVAYVSPNYFGGYWGVTETFKNADGTAFVPDGTVVRAFHGANHVLVGSGVTVDGVASFQVSTQDAVYLTASAAGDTVLTGAVTPT